MWGSTCRSPCSRRRTSASGMTGSSRSSSTTSPRRCLLLVGSTPSSRHLPSTTLSTSESARSTARSSASSSQAGCSAIWGTVASPTERLHRRFYDALGYEPGWEDRSNRLLDVETQLDWLRRARLRGRRLLLEMARNGSDRRHQTRGLAVAACRKTWMPELSPPPISMNSPAQVYFSDPQAPWQRGTNENTNGLLRQYFPKAASARHCTQSSTVAHDDGCASACSSTICPAPWDRPPGPAARHVEARSRCA